MKKGGIEQQSASQPKDRPRPRPHYETDDDDDPALAQFLKDKEVKKSLRDD